MGNQNKTADQKPPQPSNGNGNGNLIYDSSGPMQKIMEDIEEYAPHDVPVLLLGRTGTGKEEIARELHKKSLRCEGPFVIVNCAGLNNNLIESELFGHEKGAFTGADQRRIGKFETAQNGTLFLDEITEMPIESQAKLLRAVHQREIQRVGGNETIKVNARIIAATNRNPITAIREGKFRDDLYRRLNVVDIKVPRLRERRIDIPLLAKGLARKIASEHKLKTPEISPEAIDILSKYHWPGNVRQLETILTKAVIKAQKTTDLTITPEILKLPQHKIPGGFTGRLKTERKKVNDSPRSIKEILIDLVEILPKSGHNQANHTLLSKMSGSTRETIRRFFYSDDPSLDTMLSFRPCCDSPEKLEKFDELLAELVVRKAANKSSQRR